jgi:5-methylcytosine-specific restriction protein A
MPTYLLNWNPERAFKWSQNAEESDRTRRGEMVPREWGTSETKRIIPGDRIFIGKQGVEPKGVIASGYATSLCLEKAHFGDPNRQTTYDRVGFDAILDPESVLPRSELLDGPLGSVNWNGAGGGITIDDDAAAILEEKWDDWLNQIGFSSIGDVEDRSVLELFGKMSLMQGEAHTG